MWCSLTKSCEKKCVSELEGLDKISAEHTCHVTNDAQYCSNEETCQKGNNWFYVKSKNGFSVLILLELAALDPYQLGPFKKLAQK